MRDGSRVDVSLASILTATTPTSRKRLMMTDPPNRREDRKEIYRMVHIPSVKEKKGASQGKKAEFARNTKKRSQCSTSELLHGTLRISLFRPFPHEENLLNRDTEI